mmetsp:Transcript_19947/g.47109  ORF Transcript_19947/g.47109 Transcript_19947/m.47109 type:complete len:248 (-) Transcript_19947:202-945(-)
MLQLQGTSTEGAAVADEFQRQTFKACKEVSNENTSDASGGFTPTDVFLSARKTLLIHRQKSSSSFRCCIADMSVSKCSKWRSMALGRSNTKSSYCVGSFSRLPGLPGLPRVRASSPNCSCPSKCIRYKSNCCARRVSKRNLPSSCKMRWIVVSMRARSDTTPRSHGPNNPTVRDVSTGPLQCAGTWTCPKTCQLPLSSARSRGYLSGRRARIFLSFRSLRPLPSRRLCRKPKASSISRASARSRCLG